MNQAVILVGKFVLVVLILLQGASMIDAQTAPQQPSNDSIRQNTQEAENAPAKPELSEAALFASLKRNISYLKRKLSVSNQSSIPSLNAIGISVAKMQAIRSGGKIRLSKILLKSLSEQNELLELISRPNFDKKRARDQLSDMKDDFELKVLNLQSGPVFREPRYGIEWLRMGRRFYYRYNIIGYYNVRGELSVAVSTKNENGKAVDGYTVWCVPVGHADNPSMYLPFDNISSPARIRISPGRYLMWAKKGDKKIEPELRRIGAQKVPEENFDISVP